MKNSEKQAGNQEDIKQKIRLRYKGIDRNELEFIPARPKVKLFEETDVKRVCAYCRVSTDDVNQTSSYELQRNHYQEMINEHAGWTLVDIYADEGISGTSLEHRDDFNRMIRDCNAGKIDLIVTKSVSRFARNTVDCIATVRDLKNRRSPIGIFFETEHIYTLDSNGEMMLTVLSASAQEESHTKSEIMNISIEQRFSRGIFLTPKLLGYSVDNDGNLVIDEDEAKTVLLCYHLLICGFTTSEISTILNKLKRKTKRGNTHWNPSSIRNVIQNERHCGDILSHKTYTPNYLDHKSKKNCGDRNQYRQRDHHEAIVDREEYDAAQQMLSETRHCRKGYQLPVLKVVEEGVLQGFVSVNRSWAGFSVTDYSSASRSVYETEQYSGRGKIAAGMYKSARLVGYQTVRAQFFSTRNSPALTINNGSVRFNIACLKKFDRYEYVEMLYNSVEKCIAVRPCSMNNPNAIQWGRIRNSKWKALQKSCRGFSGPLFEDMGWDENYCYRFRGFYSEREKQPIMIFDLSEPEIYIPKKVLEEVAVSNFEASEEDTDNIEEKKNVDDSKRGNNKGAETDRKKRRQTFRLCFPADWRGSFGHEDEQGMILVLKRAQYYGNWEALQVAVEVPGQRLPEQRINKIREEAENMIKEMKAA